MEEINALCTPLDRTLIEITAGLGRLEAQKRARDERDLLREVAERIDADPAFRSAMIMLIVD